MRVVADTNVIVSALLWVGTPHTILVAAEEARLTLFISPALLEELEGVLQRQKFVRRLHDLQVSAAELTTGYARVAHVVLPRRVMRVVPSDLADDAVLACALAARANYLVSGDADLLRLRLYKGIRILSPTVFVRNILGLA